MTTWGQSDVFELSALTVTAQEARSEQARLMILRQRAPVVGNAISAEFIARSGAGDVAEAMSKVVGANVVDGKFAVIRGLGDRYANTLLDGAVLPGNDPSRKTFQLDIIPADVVERISTIKSFTPDRPGDFTGGSVNIETKSFPDAFEANVSFGIGYDDQATGEDILGISGSDMDFLGTTDDGLPAAAGSEPSEFRESDATDAAMYATPLFEKEREARPNTSLALSIGDSFRVFNEGRLGYVVAATRDHAFTHDAGASRGRYFLGGGGFLTAQNRFETTESAETIGTGLVGKLVLRATPDHQIAYRLLYNRVAEDSVLFGDNGFDTETEFSSPDGNRLGANETPEGVGPGTGYLQFVNMRHEERTLTSNHFSGEHYFSDLNYLKVDWLVGLNRTRQKIPLHHEYTSVVMRYDEGGSDRRFLTEGNARYPYRSFVGLTDDNGNFGVNFTQPIGWRAVDKLELKAGGLFRETDRVSRMRSFTGDFSLQLPGRDPDQRVYFFENYDEPVWLTAPIEGVPYPIPGSADIDYKELTTVSGNAQSYNGNERIAAGYLMGDVQINSLFRIIGGVRYEDSSMDVSVEEGWVYPGLLEGARKEWEDWLPAASAVITFGPADSMNLRASYGRTLARPTFREFSPFRVLDTQNKETIQGNPDLERSLVDNFDLRYEWFYGEGELLAVGVFYKDFSDPIVTTVDATPRYLYTWQNVDGGEIRGIELEARKRVFEHFSIGGNFTWTDSKIEAVGNGFGSGSVFEGQPEFIFNVDLGYEHEGLGLRANLFLTYVDDILRFVSAGSVPNIFEEANSSLNFNLTKDVGPFGFKFGVKNILNERVALYYEGNESTVYEDYRKGRVYSFTAAYHF